MTDIPLLIGGAEIATAQRHDVRDPGRVRDIVGTLAEGTPAHVEQAVAAAAKAFETWRRVPAEERCALLLKAADMLTREADSVVEIMARESGMLPGINKAEIGMAANIVKDNAELAPPYLKPESFEDEASLVSVEKMPIGVIAGIIPWNAPVILAMRKIAPALACGNTIVVKPAPTGAMGLSLLLAKMAALFPPGVINVIHGGPQTGHALVTHPLVRKVSFTGGGKVARAIMKDAAETLKGVQFELGGNDPAIVLADADLADAIPKIVGGAFRRSGQFCFAVKRIYVERAIAAEFTDRFVAEVAKFRVGHPLTAGVTFGPVNNKAQFDFVAGLTARTRAAGADVIELGAKADESGWGDGYYLLPAVVRNAAPDLEVVRVEQFGPIIPIVPVADADEAIRHANDSDLGLGSSVWSRDFDRATKIARRIEAGMTFINNAGTSRLGQRNIPFGGVKQSGIGRESSEVGLAEYVEFHAINVHK